MLFRRRSLYFAALAIGLALPFLACNSDRGSASGSGGSTAGGSGGSSAGGAGGGAFDGGSDGDAGKTYPLTFTCQPDAGADCPPGPCPEVPLSSTSCGDLPAALGHPAIPQATARPVGCMAGLPYGNPYYLDTQVQCFCMANFFLSPDSGLVAAWACAL